MKLTKKLEAEILKAYHTMWDANLSGDIKTFASFLDNNVTIYGTAAGEIFTTKNEAVKFYKATADQMTGKADFRKRKIRIKTIGDTVVINEQCDLYVFAEGAWMFYGHARVTAIFEQKGNSWKVVHMHGSFPDNRTEEGEQINTDKIKAENIQLRDAVRRRTEELENKNRELEIETALEKVRAIAMGMKSPGDMLDVCKTISLQLQSLGVKEIRNVQTAIFYESRQTYMNYEYYAKHKKTIVTETAYNNHKVAKAFAAKMLKGKGEIYITHIKGKKVKEWIAYQKTTNVFIDRFLEKASSLSYYWHSLGPVALGISTYLPLSIEDQDLFSRFLKVFELAYRRYLDIEKAAAQAKEAQIELGLERVRASAMAMRHSDGLYTTAEILYKELLKLGIESTSSGFGLIDETAKRISFYGINPADGKIFRYANQVPLTETKVFQSVFLNWKNQVASHVIELNKQETLKHETYVAKYALASLKEYGIKAPFTIKEWLANSPKEVKLHSFNFRQGFLYSIRDKKLIDVQEEIVIRFAKVFQLTYTRFLDLQKAEAQAIEAQIQLALERVRARTMAMHHSDELTEVVKLLYQEFDKLKISNESTDIEIGLIDEETGIASVWAHFYLSDGTITTFKFPIAQFLGTVDEYKKWKATPVEKRNELFFTADFSGKKWNKIIQWVKKSPELEEILRPLIEAKITRWVTHNAYFSHGMLTLQGTEPYSTETQEIQKRFTKVFEQTYTRFLDLQKAEAQAREAKIEAALERTRTQSMIMQHSNELDDVLRVFHEQVLLLGINSAFSFLWLPDEKNDRHIFWAVWGEDQNNSTVYKSKAINYPLDRNESATAQCLVDWKSNEPVYSYHVPPAAVENYFTVWRELIDGVEHLKPEYFSGGLHYVEAFMKYGCFGVMVATDLREDEKKILSRFAIEFERTYTRFLDLQKSEAQVRESQIQLALERVRARTMAMQKSEELPQVVSMLFEQIKTLGFEAFMCAIILFDKKTCSYECLMSSDVQMLLPQSYHIPYIENSFFKLYADSLLEGVPYKVLDLAGETKRDYDELLFTETDFRKLPEVTKQMMMSIKSCKLCCAYMNYGCIEAIGAEALPGEHEKILQRFAKVFEQTYTRFLDLQKAESQAREAQIEAALERIRSKTMAMQKQHELQGVMARVFEELHHLGFQINACCIIIFNKETFDEEYWFAGFEGSNVPRRFYLPYLDHPYFHAQLDAWREGIPYNVVQYSGELKESMQDWFEKNGFYEGMPEESRLALKEWDGWHTSNAYMNHGLLGVAADDPLTDEKAGILHRFAKVFEQTYTRFLDLQKAEAQAREAEIELSLERVRARTMAMQKSKELKEVIQVVYEQFVHLNIHIEHTGFIIDYKASDDMNIWLADRHEIPSQVTIPYFDCAHWNSFREAKEEGIDFFANQLSFEEKNKFYHDLFKLVPGVPEEAKKYYFSSPGLAISTVLLEDVGLYIENFSGIPYTDEENNTLMRFGKVFQQTYTRFLDLQKAEAQAKEAQIEAALERIRGKVTSMQESTELLDIVVSMRHEFVALGHQADYFWYMRWLPEKYEKAMTSGDGNRIGMIMTLPRHIHGDIKLVADWEKGDEPSVVLAMDVDTAINYVDKMIRLGDFTQVDHNAPTLDDIRHIGGLTFVMARTTHGEIGYSMPGVVSNPPAEDVASLVRFASVFDLAYRRFEDLKSAEARNREAQIELALERVRARTMAMQRSDELPEAANNLFLQIQALGIPAWSTGYCIWEDGKKAATACMSSEGVIQKPFRLPTIGEGYNFYEANKNGDSFYVAELGGEALAAHYQFMRTLPVVGEVLDGIINAGFPLPTFQIFHIVYFTHGYLMFITYQAVPEAYDIFKRFGGVFEQTYTRFLDLQQKEIQAVILKEEKEKLEHTLGELQTTQKQLIQSEKMASLGELTAGIAHEIQNPLNFVNNFSEVSNELLQEMMEEVEKGNYDIAKEIATDVRQNLEKINHHGKRADSIVKGMLQHSRSSAGTKELTDINALCDEFLRLSYHGLRAKDKSFNAKFETDFDPTVGKINIMPQDIGRVILNLINNAFYAAPLPPKGGVRDPDYKHDPTVWVSTKKEAEKIFISVKDNGPGIPKEILDKIFQPFFTTKPTGQGTGLGLSLAYDIINAHGGEIKVETKEGEGTEFIIQLPVV